MKIPRYDVYVNIAKGLSSVEDDDGLYCLDEDVALVEQQNKEMVEFIEEIVTEYHRRTSSEGNFLSFVMNRIDRAEAILKKVEES
jgi:hypothetical protein